MTTNDRTRWKAKAVVASAIAVALSTAGCVGKPASAYERDASVQCPISASDVTGKVRLGFQLIPGNDLFIHNEGVLEACLRNVEVTWTRFSSGQDVIQALAAQSADIGFAGSTPAAKALSNPLNLDIRIAEINALNGASEALVAKHAKSIPELKGQKIATAFSSTAHYGLLNALKLAGLDPAHDVEIVNISPDRLPAAWNSNEIEAAFVWNPTLAELQRTGNTLIDAGDLERKGFPTFNATLVDQAWSHTNPEILRTWLELSKWASQVYRNDSQRYISANATQAGMSFHDTEKQLSAVHLVPAADQDEQLHKAATTLFNTAVFLQGQGDAKALDPQHYRRATER